MNRFQGRMVCLVSVSACSTVDLPGRGRRWGKKLLRLAGREKNFRPMPSGAKGRQWAAPGSKRTGNQIGRQAIDDRRPTTEQQTAQEWTTANIDNGKGGRMLWCGQVSPLMDGSSVLLYKRRGMTSTRRGKQKVTYQPRPCPCQRPFSDPSTVAKGTASRAPSISNSPIWPHPIGKICPFTMQLTNNSTWAAWAETAETLRPMSGADSQSHLCWPAPGALS